MGYRHHPKSQASPPAFTTTPASIPALPTWSFTSNPHPDRCSGVLLRICHSTCSGAVGSCTQTLAPTQLNPTPLGSRLLLTTSGEPSQRSDSPIHRYVRQERQGGHQACQIRQAGCQGQGPEVVLPDSQTAFLIPLVRLHIFN